MHTKMTQKINRILYFFIVLALVVPAGVFSKSLPAKSGSQQNAPASNIFNITVVNSAFSKANISVNSNQVVAFNDCLAAKTVQNNFLQGSSQLNLNQPANCFSLTLKPAAEFSQKISFALPKIFPVVKVLTKNNFFESQSLAKNHPTNSTATETVVMLGLVLIFYSLKRLVKEVKTVKPQVVFIQKTTFELLVLRC
jgi:hypothetical protein